MKRIVLLAAVGALLIAPAAYGQGGSWTEQGDAGQLIGTQQNPIGTGPLGSISGVVGGPVGGDQADCYSILITNPANFVATTSGTGTTIDTQLFLFDKRSQNGVTHDDDDPLGGLTSRITGAFVPGPGFYALCVSRYNADPVNPTGALIWNNTPFNVERAPDGPGAPGPLANWINNTTSGGAYTIALTGVDYKPEPATLSMLALGALALLRRRR